MEITKEEFAYILGVLEEDELIDRYQFSNYNSIFVYDIEGYSDVEYKFDHNNMLIDPRIEKIQKQIDDLQTKIKNLEIEKANLCPIKK